MEKYEDKEKEFLCSLKALLIRYGIQITKGVRGFGKDIENTYVFDDTHDDYNEIFLDFDEIVSFINESE